MRNNLVELTGNLGADPTVHTDRKGRQFIRFSIATTDSYQDQQTQAWVDLPSVWHSCFAFSENAKKYAAYYRKGQRVKVTGSLTYRETHAPGLDHPIMQAAINARKIEAAPLPSRKGAKDRAEVNDASGHGVEFTSTDAPTDSDIPF